MKRDVINEQFFTVPENVEFCLSKINLKDYNTIVEPSAGDGSFSKRIDGCLAYDLNPLDPSIKEQDYLTLLTDTIHMPAPILVIGNPPFGRQSNLAIKFINKSATYADKIAFILPKSFKKDSMISRLNRHVFIDNVYELPVTTFYFGNKKFEIPCSYFIFTVDKSRLRPDPEEFTTGDFEFVSRNLANVSIRRVGFYAGKIGGLNVSESSHYFIKVIDSNAIKILKKLSFDHNNTVGARSISKNEIIKKYLELKNLGETN